MLVRRWKIVSRWTKSCLVLWTLKCISEFPSSVLALSVLALLLMLMLALFFSLRGEQINGSAAQIDRSRLSQRLSSEVTQSLALKKKKAPEGKSTERKTQHPLQLALCHFGVRRRPIMLHFSHVCGAALKHI